MTGGPRKEFGTNKLPPTGRIHEGQKERGDTNPYDPTNLPESFSLKFTLAERCTGHQERSRVRMISPVVVVQSLSRVQLFATPWTAAHQVSPSITTSWSLLKLMSIESFMPSNHIILCRPLLLPPSIFPSIRVFSVSQLLASGGQSFGTSASASLLAMHIQSSIPLGLTGLTSLQCKGLSGDFSNTTVQKHQFFCAQLSL